MNLQSLRAGAHGSPGARLFTSLLSELLVAQKYCCCHISGVGATLLKRPLLDNLVFQSAGCGRGSVQTFLMLHTFDMQHCTRFVCCAQDASVEFCRCDIFRKFLHWSWKLFSQKQIYYIKTNRVMSLIRLQFIWWRAAVYEKQDSQTFVTAINLLDFRLSHDDNAHFIPHFREK